MIPLKGGEVSSRITIQGSLSAGEVVAADIQAGCPTVIHAIDGVLLPALPAEEDAAAAKPMLGWADILGLQA